MVSVDGTDIAGSLIRVRRLNKQYRRGSETIDVLQGLNLDVAPSIIDICGAEPLRNVHGMSWKNLLRGTPADWRKSWYYEYNYEKEFPYTPNVRGVRTDEWKYVHSPNGDDQPDKYKAELYNLKNDPLETRNLIDSPDAREKLAELKAERGRATPEQVEWLTALLAADLHATIWRPSDWLSGRIEAELVRR